MTAPAPASPSGQILDTELIHRIAAGDSDAAAELFRRHRPAMFAFACALTRDPVLADDVAQEASLQAWRDAERYDLNRGSVVSWLQVMVRGRALDRLRSRQTVDKRIQQGCDPDTLGSGQCPVDRALDSRTRMRGIDAALELLPQHERQTIRLAYYEGLTHTEIAARLAVPLGTAKTQLRRGMQMLRTAVDDRPRRPFEMNERPRRKAAGVVSLRGLDILIVDDEPDTVKLTALVLTRAGAGVSCAASAGEAIQRLDTLWPDLALIDLGMPDATGYAVMARVRELRQRFARGLPTVAFTAMSSAGERGETRAAGFALHLAKPIGPARLVDALASVVRASKERRRSCQPLGEPDRPSASGAAHPVRPPHVAS